MSRDDVLRMAREADPFGRAGRLYVMAELAPETLERFAALVAAAERAEVERLRAAGTVAVLEMGKLTRHGICEDSHHAKRDQHAGDATDCPVARRFCDARVLLESAINAAREAQP